MFLLICTVAMILTVVGGIVLLTKKARDKQIAQYRQWAQQHGLHYTAVDPTVAAMSTRVPFGIGNNRTGRDVFRTTYNGRHLVFGEYSFTKGPNKNLQRHIAQFVAIPLPTPRPYLNVAREDVVSQLFAVFGRRGIRLGNEEFNRLFHVETDSERFAHDVLSLQLMQWLIDSGTKAYPFRIEGQWLMTLSRQELQLNDIYIHADFLHGLLNRIPHHVWQG